MTLIHLPQSLLVVQIVIGAFYAFGLRLTSASTEELEALLAQAFIDAMHAAHLNYKTIASDMGIDQPTLCKQLARTAHHHLSLMRMLRLPFAFWLHFGPALMAVIYRKRLAEFAETAKDLAGRQ